MADSGLTVGVEEEFFLVDTAGLLVNQAPEALRGADDVDLKPELMRCQVESATEICRTADDVRTELTDLRGRLCAGARGQGAMLVASGTVSHTQSKLSVIGPGTRYHDIAEHVGEFVFSGMTCGCHVHVGVDDRTTALFVANHIRPWLPVLLALTANSPFFDGRDTGYASARHLLWGRWPSAGPPPYISSVDEYEEIVRGMLGVGAAMDRKMIYWDVRPSEHQPTVEVRVADVAGTVDEATLQAVLVRCLVADALSSGKPAPKVPTEIIRAAQWRAAKDGIAAELPDPITGESLGVHEIVDGLVQRHASELRAWGELEFVESTLSWLRINGDGAHRQRQAFAREGDLDHVVDMLAAQTRLPGAPKG
ncbi:MAG: glutamate--cysteine ligase [Actinomycetota bacterium]|nr:glutamate--cysteine ligase [Actinomycetota bacterium]